MKKLLTFIATFCLMAAGGSAQDKKTWDFTAGLSPETVTNLNADDTNWAPNGTNSEGVTNNWKNHTKHSASEPWTANGEVIKELEGLLIDIGSNGDNSLHLAQDKLRLTRKGTKITFPQLVNGQTVTIVGRSANKTATNRGIAPVQDYLTLTQGVTTDGACIFLGADVDGSLGTYSFTWVVETSESGPVDVQFQLTPEAGIDFTLFMIDEGDVLQTAKVIYLYDGTEDIIYNYLSAREATELSTFNVTTAEISAEDLQQYDVVIVGASVPADNAVVATLKEAMQWVPVLNLNAQLYAAWGYGSAVSTSGFIRISDSKNRLFNNVNYEESDEGNVIIMSNSGLEANMQAVTLGEYFSNDVVAAVTVDGEDNVALHTHSLNHNGYVFMPYVDDYSDDALQLLENVIVALQGGKSDITTAPTPVISREYKNMETIVTIAPPALPGARVFYTTDGNDPTVESDEYSSPITVTSECTVKASAIAEGYTLSKPASLLVLVKEQPAAPTISFEERKGQTKITFDCATPDAQIWYNFKNSTDTIASSLYTPDSVDVVIFMPQDVTAFATLGEPGEAVFSEITQQRVLVRKPRVVIDVAGHFRAPKWEDVANGSGVFPNGKTATSMYDTSAEPIITTDPETGDETETYPEVEWMTRDEASETPEWQVMSKGQSVLWQNLTAQTGQIGTNEGGYFPSVAEDIDPLFPITSYDIQFYQIFAGEPANAAIMSKKKYQGPLDIVTIANMQGGPLLAQVSTDGETWTTVGDEIEKTGFTRMWKKYTNSYNGTDEVYVRVAQNSGGQGAKVFDIYVAIEGEQSKALLEQLHQEYGDWDDAEANGDVNGDGAVNVADISAIITVMAEGGDEVAADVNGDGSVNVADISAVIDIMAGK